MIPSIPKSEDKFLTLKQLKIKTGVGRTTLYRYMMIGIFPKPIKLGGKSLWLSSDVDKWIMKSIKQSRKNVRK